MVVYTIKYILTTFVKRFRPSVRLASNSQEKFTILNVPHIESLVFLASDKIFLSGTLSRNKGLIYKQIYKEYKKKNVLTNHKRSRDNSKVITFFAFQRVGFGFLTIKTVFCSRSQ